MMSWVPQSSRNFSSLEAGSPKSRALFSLEGSETDPTCLLQRLWLQAFLGVWLRHSSLCPCLPITLFPESVLSQTFLFSLKNTVFGFMC